MVKKKHGVIIETPTEARQAEPGPSILRVLLSSVAIAVAAMGVVWLVVCEQYVFRRPIILVSGRAPSGRGTTKS